MKKPKKNTKPVASNNKKEATKSKQMLNKSMEKKKKVGISLTTEPNKNSTIEVKNAKDKISIVKPIKKDRGGNQKSSSMTNRSAKSTKSKEYDNKLNEDNNYEIEKTKEYDFFSYKEKPKPKTTKPNEDDNSEEGGKEKGDFLYRTMYKTNVDSNKGSNLDNMKTPDTQKIKQDIDISKSKEKPVEQPASNQFAISMERTDDITYDIGDKKIHSNIKKSYQYNNYKANNDYKNESEDSTAIKYSDNNNKKSNYNSGSNYDRPSTSTYSSKTPSNYINERTIDLFVIDTDGEEPVVSTRNKKRIDRTRNKIKEVKIEKYDAKTPIRDEKLTGFVLIRKSKGKRIYDVEFEDDFDKINEILRNKKVMIKNEIIQFATLTKLTNYERDIKNYTDKISRLQNDINKKDYSKGRDNDDNKYRDYENQISELKSKNNELNKKAYKLQDELDENIREFKQVKLAYDQLKDSIEREKLEREKLEKERMEKEKKEKEQVVKEEPSKIKKKAAQMQQDENNDQKAIKEMKLRIKKYKDVLRNPDEKNKIPFTYRQDDASKGNISPTKKRQKANIVVPENKEIQVQETQPAEEEDDDIGEYVLGDEDAKDPRKRKMKNAVNRFRNKYKEVIKEEKKAQREKEKEEKEREENEERELEDENYQEEKERQEREREEQERQERERKEREERERKEREERERKEREERERREREERERREREERERKERERKEKERKEREERERKEKEKRDREEKERKEKEKKEREKKEKDKKDNKPAMGGARMGGGKMGGNFAKMLADKLKMAPPGGMKKGAGAKRDSISKPPVIEKNVDVTKLLEEQPFQGRKDKKKPTRKVFVIEDDDE